MILGLRCVSLLTCRLPKRATSRRKSPICTYWSPGTTTGASLAVIPCHSNISTSLSWGVPLLFPLYQMLNLGRVPVPENQFWTGGADHSLYKGTGGRFCHTLVSITRAQPQLEVDCKAVMVLRRSVCTAVGPHVSSPFCRKSVDPW